MGAWLFFLYSVVLLATSQGVGDGEVMKGEGKEIMEKCWKEKDGEKKGGSLYDDGGGADPLSRAKIVARGLSTFVLSPMIIVVGGASVLYTVYWTFFERP